MAGSLTGPAFRLGLPKQEGKDRRADDACQKADRNLHLGDAARDIIHAEELDSAEKNRRWQKPGMLWSDQHAGKMRHDEPDPTDAATDRDLRRDQ
jgi:hypothetical protein